MLTVVVTVQQTLSYCFDDDDDVVDVVDDEKMQLLPEVVVVRIDTVAAPEKASTAAQVSNVIQHDSL